LVDECSAKRVITTRSISLEKYDKLEIGRQDVATSGSRDDFLTKGSTRACLSCACCVLDEDPAPLHKRGRSPQFLVYICCGQMAGWIKMPLCKRKGKEEYLYSAFLHQGTHKALRHGPHSFTCKQHHACLCREVGLSQSDIVLDGDPAPLPQNGAEPQFSAHISCSQMAGWIKMALGMEVGLSQATLC